MNHVIQTLDIQRLGSDYAPIYQVSSRDGSYSYTVHSSEMSEPHLTVTKQTRAPPPYHGPPAQFGHAKNSAPVYNQTVGTAKFHTISSKLDISMPSGPITMKRPNPLASGRQFQTGTPLGTLEWKGGSLLKSDLELLDRNGRVLARYRKKKSSFLSSKGQETLDLCVPGLEPYIDLIVITVFATLECKRRSDGEWEEMFDIF